MFMMGCLMFFFLRKLIDFKSQVPKIGYGGMFALGFVSFISALIREK